MQIKLLKDVVSSIVGPNASKIVDLLYEKKNVNEFLIAKKLGLTINQTRNILYKLADEGLVSFIRKKDAKKGGWYTYFWTLNSGKSLVKFKDHLLKMLNEAKRKIDLRKVGRFYYCINCGIEYDEEVSLLNSYTCPECGEPLQLKDNSVELVALNKDVERIELILVEVDQELQVIGVKDQKIKERKAKAEQKKKDKERLERKKERDKLKKNGLAVKAKKNSKKGKSKKK